MSDFIVEVTTTVLVTRSDHFQDAANLAASQVQDGGIGDARKRGNGVDAIVQSVDVTRVTKQ